MSVVDFIKKELGEIQLLIQMAIEENDIEFVRECEEIYSLNITAINILDPCSIPS